MESTEDLLTEAVESLKVDSSTTFLFEFTDPWGFCTDFPHPLCWSLLEGRAWLIAPGQAPLCLEAGDSVILPRGTASGATLFLSSPEAAPFPVADFWRQNELPAFDPTQRAVPRRIRWGGLGQQVTRVVSLAFSFHDVRLRPLIQSLPEQMVVRAADVSPAFVRPLLAYPFDHEDDDQAGAHALVMMSTQLLLMYLVRTFLLRHAGQGRNWLAGWSDPRIARVLLAVHRAPQQPWPLERLAEVACMSRAVFAKRFAECTGQSPARYVCEWRMQLAREALSAGRSLRELAGELGYQSEAAFRAAFRRITGQAPHVFQRAAKP